MQHVRELFHFINLLTHSSAPLCLSHVKYCWIMFTTAEKVCVVHQQESRCLRFRVFSSFPLSQIYLSWKSGPGEVKHWKDMLARPRTNVAQWHALKA